MANLYQMRIAPKVYDLLHLKIGDADNTFEDFLEEYNLDHAASAAEEEHIEEFVDIAVGLHRGYVSKYERIVVPYKGRYGVGYAVADHCPSSSNYYICTYWVNRRGKHGK